MKIMVTGGAGFIGSHLVDELVEKMNKVFVVTKSNLKKENLKKSRKKIIITKCSITDFKKMGKLIESIKPDVIIHLAGQTSHSRSFDSPLEGIDTDVKATLFILEKIRSLGIKCRFVLGSTFVVVGRPKSLPVDEDSPCNPTMLYGANKLTSENYCKIYHKVYGLDTVIFRITNSYGPREQIIPQKNAVNFLIHTAFKKQDITIYNKGRFYRDLIYISDVISAIMIIMKKGKSGEIYWISSNNKTWFYELAELLNKITGAKIKYVKAPNYNKKVDVGNFIVNNKKLKALGWKQKISLKKGITKTLEYFSNTN